MSNPSQDTMTQEKPEKEDIKDKRIKDLERSYQEKATLYNKLLKENASLKTEVDFYKTSIDELNLFTTEEKEKLQTLHLEGDHESYTREVLNCRNNAYKRLEEQKKYALDEANKSLLEKQIKEEELEVERLGINLNDIPYGVVREAKNGNISLLAWVKENMIQKERPQQQEPNMNAIGTASPIIDYSRYQGLI